MMLKKKSQHVRIERNSKITVQWPYFIAGKTGLEDETAHLYICSSGSDPFLHDSRVHSFLQCFAASQLRRSIRKNFF